MQRAKTVLAGILDCTESEVDLLLNTNINFREAADEMRERLPYSAFTFTDFLQEVFLDTMAKQGLEMGIDADLYVNGSEDTHLYVKEGLEPQKVKALEDALGMDAEETKPW